MSYFWGHDRDQKVFLGSTHVAEQLLFSMFPSNLTFGFDSILGSFFTLWDSNGLFLKLG